MHNLIDLIDAAIYLSPVVILVVTLARLTVFRAAH